MSELRIRVAVSACLLGERVRHDGGHKLEPAMAQALGRCFEWVSICPEVELGMGTPRPPIRLEEAALGIRLLEPESGRDYTEAMRELARQRAQELEHLGVCGYVWKSSSPSCGLSGVELWAAGETTLRRGRGVFADELLRRLPSLPVAEEQELRADAPRGHFVRRVRAYHESRADTNDG